jgi:plastocyanin
MKRAIALCALGATLGLAFAAPAGDITGKITLKGTPPPEKPIDPLKNDPNCGKLVTGTPTTRFYVVGKGGELADAVVYLKGISGKSTGPSAAPIVIDQVKCEYTPYITAVQTGQKIRVKNSDPVLHNVHTTPAVAGNEEKNMAQMPGAADLEFAFPKAEDFLRFKCDVHPWMFSYVTVVDHPYYAVTGADGTFKIANVPAGKYTLVALHRKAAPAGATQEIEVTDAGAKADFTLELK